MNECSLDECSRPRVTSTGLCNMHRMRLKQNGDVGEASGRWNFVVDGRKFCKMCERVLPEDSFGRRKNGKIHTYCTECYPSYIKYRNILIKFNLTKPEYDSLVKNGCAVCGDTHRLSVDHDHSCCQGKESCGKCVRGVLCMRHNLLLGHARDSVKELESIIKYIKEYQNCE